MLGQTISNYKILRQIGSGGMGMVYLAQHATLERYAAVKVLNPEYSGNKFLRKDFCMKRQLWLSLIILI
ncbi:MAG: hypothetical protein IPL16_18345 [Ignavibacteria bacterium]|nr:hypothetical protein [Ignavibacteria bacterium]